MEVEHPRFLRSGVLIVLPAMQNGRVNKFDPESVEVMLALDAAMDNHPDPKDGPLQRF